HALTHCTTQAVPRDHLHSEPCTNTLHHTSMYLGTTCTVSHALTHCTTQAVPMHHLHSEPCTNTLHHTSCT
ncbi:predicted protein, partial [Nematostella vectensis]